MKKLAGFLFLLFAANTLNAQTLGVVNPDGGSQFPWLISSPVAIPMDYCTEEGTITFLFKAQKTFEQYYPLGHTQWVIMCGLKDVTANVAATPTYYSPATAVNVTALQALSGPVFHFNVDHTFSFTFANVAVKSGHEYEVTMTILDYPSSAPSTPNTIVTETSNRMKINGKFEFVKNAWNHKIISPSFISVGDGLMSGNYGNGEEYFVGTDNKLYLTDNSWNISAIDGGRSVGANNGTVLVNQGNGEVYFEGADTKLYYAKWNKYGTGWTNSIDPLMPFFAGGATHGMAINQTTGHIYWIGTDGKLYYSYWNSFLGKWDASQLVPGWSGTTFEPGAMAVNQTTGNVFFIGTDHRVYNAYKTGSTWNIAVLNSFSSAAFGAIDVNDGNNNVYFVGLDNRLYNAYSGSGWTTVPVNSTFFGVAPGAVSVNQGNGHVYFIGTNNQVYNAVFSGGIWNMWSLGSYHASAGTLGRMERTVGNHVYDIVFHKNEYGQLGAYIWASCSAAKQSPINTTGIANASQASASIENTLSIVPNPVTSNAIVNYSLNTETNTRLAVYNINGALIKELVNAKQSIGKYRVEFNKGDIPQGVYYLMLQTGNGDRKVEKLVIQ